VGCTAPREAWSVKSSAPTSSTASAAVEEPAAVVVRSDEDLVHAWGRRVRVIGRYERMMLPTSARPGAPSEPSGRVEVVVGRRSLALDTHARGIRSEEEVQRFVGRRVVVVGTAREHAQLWGRPDEAAIVSAALVDVERIELATPE
jgi:hypothetical protein